MMMVGRNGIFDENENDEGFSKLNYITRIYKQLFFTTYENGKKKRRNGNIQRKHIRETERAKKSLFVN
jgi:hypothetical protein